MNEGIRRSPLAIRGAGYALIAAGLCYLPLGLIDGWQGIAGIGTPGWWLVQTLAASHHVFLLFGLLALFSIAIRRPGASGLGAFIAASTGNLLVTGSSAIQLTILPALATHPEASAAIECTPFYTPATRAATAFVDQACSAWQFGALDSWVGLARVTLALGSIWFAAELIRAGEVARTAGILLGLGWAVRLAGLGIPLPEFVSDAAWLGIAAGLAWCGITLARWPAARAAMTR